MTTHTPHPWPSWCDWRRLVAATLMIATAACGGAYRQGQSSARNGDWDTAVEYYDRALRDDPDRPEYRIALERAMINASRAHNELGRAYEAEQDLSAALREYKAAAEFDPSNGEVRARAATLDRIIRERIEEARPPAPIEALREQARRETAPPLLNPASRDTLTFEFRDTSLQDLIDFIGDATGINVTYDEQFEDSEVSFRIDGMTLEETLAHVLSTNQSFYKVLNPSTIIIVPETPQKRAQYDEQVIQTFFVSHADVQELSQLLSQIVRVPQMAVQPSVIPNTVANTITVRATTAVTAIIEQVIAANDKPLAEIIIDVEILEVNRERAKRYGLNLTDYAIGGVFSPEVAAPNDAAIAPSGIGSGPPFNLNTISQGVSTADFYLGVPAAVVRFLETDSSTRLVAKPQLRGQEGQQMTLNLGEDIPVPATAFTAIAAGGAAVNPLTSFNYRPVGVILEMTPRVTYENEIILDLVVENSTLGANIDVAGTSLPTFGSRRVETRLRLRDGESNLLAGLLREEDRRTMRGLAGALRVPILRSLFGDSDTQIRQTDIVILLTPRVLRTHELTQRDVSPIHIGTQTNFGLTGAPPLIAAQPDAGAPNLSAPERGVPDADDPGGDAPDAPAVEPDPLGAVTLPPTLLPTPELVPAPPVPGAPDAPLAGTTPDQVDTPEPTPETPAPAPVIPAPEPAIPAPEPAAPEPEPEPVIPEPALAVPVEPEPVIPPPSAEVEPLPAAETELEAATRVLVTPPGAQFRIGGGPYTVPVAIRGATQMSEVSLTLLFDPNILRVRTVQQGSFLRQGGVEVTFSQEVDTAAGRIDILGIRIGDAVGASGAGLLAAVLFDAVGVGSATLVTSGTATTPGGAPIALAFTQSTVAVQ
jgi:type II secretory pathway component GspD/PulD (secretin)